MDTKDMWRAGLLCYVLIAWTVTSTASLACVFPTPLRVVNKTLGQQIDRGGEVGIYVRNTLRRALDSMPADAMLTTLAESASRAEMRSARAVLGVAGTLADGRGRVIHPSLKEHTSRLDEAIQLACSDGTQGASGVSEATSVESGGARKNVGSGRGLTFGQGLARLSIAFSLYVVFLVFLFAFRQMYHRQYATRAADTSMAADPAVTATPQDMRPDT